ncbi:Alpha/Beta hydrolase protein [Pseudomassariella vexata]|uniref:Alpha/Beta hydrolase protein n=1 Tax=Pseudomassariella vexata TaxID=1141098 RepID=A0A1Y2DTB9_9PEZI|nr:Alpha/Beta hydrolase protein [Pseudomassariella vexata]ORY62522.1 Alpha/Beta hydrolase protein [Pseudomassariella vexata]
MENKKGSLKEKAKAQLAILRVILPLLPFISRVILLHVLGKSETSKYLDLKSVLLVSILQRLCDPPQNKLQSITKLQALTTRDVPVKGRIWVSHVAAVVPPDTSIRDVLIAAIEGTKRDLVPGSADCRIPEIVPVEAEWTGYREDASREAKPPAVTEEEKYLRMMKGCKSPVTVLYFHGGAYYLMDPASHRPAVKNISKLTGGRVYSVRYRLAPQHPFPSALLDALVSYFTLLYPPPGSVHEAVPPENIVFGGDSAGGNLSLALLQTLLEIRRQNQRITWFHEDRHVPLPGGVTAISPWLDVVQGMPSWKRNQTWDYLPPPNVLDRKDPPCAAWPSNPPRRHVFIDDDYLLHPMASLTLSKSWKGAPPVYLTCGWECLADEGKWLVKKLSHDGVPVVFEEYEAMPHVFAFILTKRPEAARCLAGLTNFMKVAVENPAKIASRYTTIKARTCEEVKIDVDSLSPHSQDDLRKMAYMMIGTDSMPSAPIAKL